MTFIITDLSILLRSVRLESDAKEFSWRRVFKTCRLYRARARQRRQLLSLNDLQLKDIGVSRCDAVREAEKPFWQE